MPMKTVVKRAARSSSSSSSSWATFSETSVLKYIGWPWASLHSAIARSSSLASFLLPMKLSSTRKTCVAPRRWHSAISAITCGTDLTRGRRP